MGNFKGICKLFFAILLALALTVSCLGCVNREIKDTDSLPSDAESSSGEDSSSDPSESEDPKDPPAWSTNFDLPDAEGALQKLVEIYGDSNKVFLLRDGLIARMPCPQGEVITVNVAFDMGEYTKLVLEDSIAEFNEVFAVINPNYKFAVNYSPTEDDFKQKYSVKLVASDNLAVTETSQVFGVAHMGYYNNYTELGDFGITIKTEVFNNGSYLMTTFKHELMHLLGAGDAYKNSEATKATVMQSYTVSGYHHLSATDVAFLDTLYRNPEFVGNEKITEFIDTYEEKTLHTRAILTAAVYNRLVSKLDSATVKAEATALDYKDPTDFFATIKDGIVRDTAFGNSNASFRELERNEPSETYSGKVEPNDGRYWHGVKKAGSSMESSMGIGYTDYGNGILYTAPNGNKYTILIKTGEFVLAFRLGGSFTNFEALSLTLWFISK